MKFYDGLNFQKNKKICMEIVAEEQGLALQQKNSNRHKISFFNSRGFRRGRFDVFEMLFSISGILKVAAFNFM